MGHPPYSPETSFEHLHVSLNAIPDSSAKIEADRRQIEEPQNVRLTASLKAVRMDSDKAAETAEIQHVQCKDVTHAVDVHRGGQPCIVDLNAQDAVLQDNSPPLTINRIVVGQESHASLDCAYFALGIGNGQTKAVAVERAGHGVPKLSDILMRVMQNGALTGELSERCIYDLVLGIGASRHAQKDIGVDQARANRHLVVILVDPLARNSLRQRGNLVRELGQ